MKKQIAYTILSALCAGLFLASCVKKPSYPSEPVIAYKEFIRYGNPSDPDSVEVVVSFTDNEGDIGLYQSDTGGIFEFGNIFLENYFWDTVGDDHWEPVDDLLTPQPDTMVTPYRIPPVLPDGDPDEPVKGLILVKMVPDQIVFKRIKYVIYMYDRAKHKSNVIESEPIDF